MDTEQEWADRTKRFLKAEWKRQDVIYDELARQMTEMGLQKTDVAISNRISRAASQPCPSSPA